MNRNTTIALVIIALLAILFIVNRGRTDVNLLVVEFSMLKSLVFLGFTGAGVAIGLLLK